MNAARHPQGGKAPKSAGAAMSCQPEAKNPEVWALLRWHGAGLEAGAASRLGAPAPLSASGGPFVAVKR